VTIIYPLRRWKLVRLVDWCIVRCGDHRRSAGPVGSRGPLHSDKVPPRRRRVWFCVRCQCSYEVDSDQELLACGLYNTVGAFFGCFVSTQAPPRTLVHETVGGRTQLAGFVSTLVPLLVVLAIGSWFEALPISVLGCITSCAILPLMKQFSQLR